MEIKNYAPVIIPTLCRYEKFRNYIETLSKCTGADKTTVIIGLDYPLNQTHIAGYQEIKKYLQSGGG